MVDNQKGDRCFRSIAAEYQLNAGTGRGMFHGVIQQNRQQLLQPPGICLNGRHGGIGQGEGQPVGGMSGQQIKLVVQFDAQIVRRYSFQMCGQVA